MEADLVVGQYTNHGISQVFIFMCKNVIFLMLDFSLFLFYSLFYFQYQIFFLNLSSTRLRFLLSIGVIGNEQVYLTADPE